VKDLTDLIRKWQTLAEEAASLRYLLRNKKLDLIEMEGEVDIELAFNDELKNEEQRKAKRYKILKERGWVELQREINELEHQLAVKEIWAEIVSRTLRVMMMTFGREEEGENG